MSDQTGKIPELAIKIVTGLSYGAAISVAIARIILRLHANKGLRLAKRLQLDDWLLVVACASLTAGTAVLFDATPTVYLIEATSLNPTGLFGGGGAGIKDLNTLLVKLDFFARFNWIYLILTWTTIFAVKFGFLSFFRTLVARLPGIHLYWRIVVGVTIIVYLFSLVDGVVACPHVGLRALSCSVDYARKIGAIAIALDILTDVMILAIPLNILWRVKMQTQQKLGLAAFLCLQVLMIVLAIIRISGFVYHDAFDMGWVYLWQQIESCVSVSAISLTAFRIMFVANASRRSGRNPWQWTDSFKRRFYRKYSEGQSGSGELDDVSIPGATMTGMRTAIGAPPRTRDGTTMFSIFDEEAEEYPLRPIAMRRPLGRLRAGEHFRRSSLRRHRGDDHAAGIGLGRPQRLY